MTALPNYQSVNREAVTRWMRAGRVEDFPAGAGATVKFGSLQIAVFYFARKERWYACQNLCTHRLENVLGRGLLGDQNGLPKVACPLHKKTFSLESGANLNGDCPPIAVYPVEVRNGEVFIGLAN